MLRALLTTTEETKKFVYVNEGGYPTRDSIETFKVTMYNSIKFLLVT